MVGWVRGNKKYFIFGQVDRTVPVTRGHTSKSTETKFAKMKIKVTVSCMSRSYVAFMFEKK